MLDPPPLVVGGAGGGSGCAVPGAGRKKGRGYVQGLQLPLLGCDAPIPL